MLWNSFTRLQHPETLTQVQAIALPIAVLTLIAKELLFRYLLHGLRTWDTPRRRRR